MTRYARLRATWVCRWTHSTLHTVCRMTHWRSVQTGVPELLSVEDKQLLGL